MHVTKYNASGNDFVIFHTFKEFDASTLARKLCHRQEGVGADGLIVLLPNSVCDFKWQFYNSDGSEASMCGNGTRACAHYAYHNGLAKEKMTFLTGAGVISSTVDGNMVETQLTQPQILSDIFEEMGFVWHFVDTGVPHLVTFADTADVFDKDIARQMRYKYNTNVNFAYIKDEDLHVRTYERGVEDETLACGTGMAASFYCAFLQGLVASTVRVYPKSQEELYLKMDEGNLYFKGEVHRVFETDIELSYF
ncbi:MAG: diaminopimelate epimerase [Sulfurospirillaceae bacterium]|nr:diaminopimelate epimerase [Sulfurospirillaceae bacterium]MDD3462069.1 diaminopimelate epimerase [Sulfurospirillaceae bacterium]